MGIKTIICAQLFAVSCIVLADGASGAPDKYSDGKLSVEWVNAGDDFSGTITLGSQQFPATAHTRADGIDGTFTSGTNQFPFTASLNAQTLTLTTGGATYVLKKESVVGNPLASANPLTSDASSAPVSAPGAAQSDSAMPGYSVVTSTDFGKAWTVQKDGATSIQAALETTLPDLARYFGAKPTVGSAYQDAKDAKSGGATFSAALNGQPVKGIISCKITDKGAAVAVIYARAGTSKADWDKLMAPQTSAPADAAASRQASASVAPQPPTFPLKEFDFPDGTGSLELADGWTTKQQTCINPVFITGPAKQNIVLNNMLHIDTPDAPSQQTRARFERMNQQMAASARAQGRSFTPMPAPPGPPPLVSPYLAPVDALKKMLPQFSAIAQYNHGPSTTLDTIISVKDANSVLAGGKGAIIAYTYTETMNGVQTHLRRSVYLQTVPQGQWGWLWLVTGVAAPEATFSQDAPLMFAMVNSLKVNQAQFTQNLNAQTQTNIHNTQVLGQAENAQLQATAQIGRDNMNTQNSIHQQQYQAQMDGYHQHNEQWAADETQKQRNTADFIETIQGTRAVVDTQTGATGYANLSDVNGVVDSLNQAALDPNRFVQVPLRDYLYAPTPAPTR